MGTSRRAPANEINSIKRQCMKLPGFSNYDITRYANGRYWVYVAWSDGLKDQGFMADTELQAWRGLKAKLDELDAIAKRLKSC